MSGYRERGCPLFEIYPHLGSWERTALSGVCGNIGRYIHPHLECPYAGRMTNWKTPPEEKAEDTAPLFAKMARVEGLALTVVEDEVGDASFKLLSLIVGWMATLQKRIGVAERWARRAQRKKAMLASEALRINMCDRLGGVGALERWEARAKLALSFSRQAGDPAAAQRAHRRDDGKDGQHCRAGSFATSDRRSDVPFGTAPSPQRRPGSPEGVREFALARLPGRGVRKVTTRIVRAAPKHETPILVWPCEVMPERFAREWWLEAAPEGRSQTNKNTDAFPESAAGKYPGSREEETDGYGLKALDPAAAQRGTRPGIRSIGESGSDVGGPGLNPGTYVLPGLL